MNRPGIDYEPYSSLELCRASGPSDGLVHVKISGFERALCGSGAGRIVDGEPSKDTVECNVCADIAELKEGVSHG